MVSVRYLLIDVKGALVSKEEVSLSLYCIELSDIFIWKLFEK